MKLLFGAKQEEGKFMKMAICDICKTDKEFYLYKTPIGNMCVKCLKVAADMARFTEEQNPHHSSKSQYQLPSLPEDISLPENCSSVSIDQFDSE